MRNNPAEKGSRPGLNHAAMVALHFMHYIYCRIHQTLGVTPAMQVGPLSPSAREFYLPSHVTAAP
jgi:hypothetical protein